MAAGVPVTRVEERAFEMIAGHHKRPEPACRHRRIERQEPLAQLVRMRGNQRGQALGDARCQHGFERAVQRRGRDGRVVEIDPGIAIDLQVE
ncbi:hypothetical protein D3C72_2260870 [compost metagenome]